MNGSEDPPPNPKLRPSRPVAIAGSSCSSRNASCTKGTFGLMPDGNRLPAAEEVMVPRLTGTAVFVTGKAVSAPVNVKLTRLSPDPSVTVLPDGEQSAMLKQLN